jgi:AcrR family transcriptional regulator
VDTLEAVTDSEESRRPRLTREQVLARAVELADEIGVDALTMRRLAQDLDVVPMALYKHVANKDELLGGMVDTIIREIPPIGAGLPWRDAAIARIHEARRSLQRHPWARAVIETRTTKTPAVLDYLESFTAIFLDAGFSADLTHHAMHAIGGRMWGFTQELFDDSAQPQPVLAPEQQAALVAAMATRYPNILRVATASSHDENSVVGQGCDDEFEFDFALDLVFDGIEQRHKAHWSSTRESVQRTSVSDSRMTSL